MVEKKQKHAARKSGNHLEISFYFLLLDAFNAMHSRLVKSFLFFIQKKNTAEKQTVEVFDEMSCEVKRKTRLANSFATKKTLSSALKPFSNDSEIIK